MEHQGNEETRNPLMHEVLADDAREGHEKRLARYSAAKARQQVVSEFILQQNSFSDKPTLEREQKALDDCGSFLIYRHYYVVDRYRLLAGCTCKKHLLCALCAIRRAAKCVAVYSEKIDIVTAGQEYDTLLVTLTIKNGYDLAERYEHLQTSVKKLLHRRRNALLKNPKTDTLFKHVVGAIYSYEVTVNDLDEFHPHVHMIVMVPKGTFHFDEITIKKKVVKVPVSLQQGLVKDWKEITGDSFIVDVRLIEDEKDKISALVETFKYALKFSEMAVETQVACYRVLKCRRMIGSMGALFGVKLPDSLNDPLLPGEEKYVDLVYQYSGVNFGYQMVSHGHAEIQENSSQRRKSSKKKRKDPDGPEAKFAVQVSDYRKKAAFYGTTDAIKEKARERIDLIERTGQEPVPF